MDTTLKWVVDISSIGVSIAYFYTAYTAYYIFQWSDSKVIDSMKQLVSPGKKFISLLGIIAGSIFILLLIVLGSPVFLESESGIALLVWIILELVFYKKEGI